MVTVWVTAGRGSLGVSPSECSEAGLYVLAVGDVYAQDRTVGFNAVSVTAPYSSPPFGGMKNNQFLPRVLAQMSAEGARMDVVSLP
jgi:hypothetical protein